MVTTILSSPTVPCSRLPRVAGAAGVLLSAMLLATSAGAALREYRVHFEPSPSSSAAGYSLHIGPDSGNYSTEFDLGAPPPDGGTVIYAVDLEDSIDLFVALRAYDSTGMQSAFSNELTVAAVVPAPPPPPPTTDPGDDGSTGGDPGGDTTTPPDDDTTGGDDGNAGVGGLIDDDARLGLSTTSDGVINTVFADGHLDFLTMDSLAARGDLRPIHCDLDGDGDRDLVIGFGGGSRGQIAVVFLEDDAVVSVSTIVAGTSRYQERSGRTNPACGDLDGDGRGELVVGFDYRMLGVVQVFDDVETGFNPKASQRSDANGFMQIPISSENKLEMYPAIGNIDNDDMDELVVGMGRVHGGGRLVILDDLSTGFAIHPGNRTGDDWIELNANPNRIQRRTWTMPALGDIDGDGRDEIAVAFGSGSRGVILVLNDAVDGFPTSPTDVSRIATGRTTYRKNDGETRVAIANVDADASEELIVGFQRNAGREVQVFDDAASNMAPMTDDNGFVSANDSSIKITPIPMN